MAATVLALLGVLHAGAASAGLFEDSDARQAILDLRQKLDTLEKGIDQKLTDQADTVTQLRRSMLDLQSQLDGARADIAKLRGDNEQLVRSLADVQRKQLDSAQSLDARLRTLEPARVSVDGVEITVQPAEQRDYDTAMGVFRKGDFANAQQFFVDFLNRYPNTGYRPTALFWLGNAQYASKNYKDAMASFRTLIAVAPSHFRVPEAVLAIANCQLEMKDLKAARKTLEDLLANYPGSEAASAAKDRLARLK